MKKPCERCKAPQKCPQPNCLLEKDLKRIEHKRKKKIKLILYSEMTRNQKINHDNNLYGTGNEED